MAKSKKLEKIASIEKLELISRTVSMIKHKRIEAAVTSIKKNEDVHKFLHMFSNLNCYLVEEFDFLFENTEQYRKFATDINGRYSLAYKLLEHIKRDIYALSQLINNTSNKPKLYHSFVQTSTDSIEYKLEHSYMGSMAYTPYVLNAKSPAQERLVEEIKTFLSYLQKSFNLCLSVLNDEKRVAESQDESLLAFEKQIDEIYQYMKGNVKHKPIDEEYYYDLLDVDNKPANAQKWYHKITPSDLVQVAIARREKMLSAYTEIERKVFGYNKDAIIDFRTIVAHYVQNGEKITGEILAYIYVYFKSCCSQKAFCKCFTEVYRLLGGKNTVACYSMFNTAYGQYGIGQLSGYNDFQLQFDSICVS